MSSFPRKKSSPARERLAETVAARQSTESKLANVRASLARLADHEASVTAAEQKLAALNAAEADATLKWAKSGKGDAPAVNADRREEISKALAAARAQAAAAAAARASLEAEASAASANLPGIEKWSKAAIAQIVAEEAEPLIAELTESMRAIAGKQERLKQMFAFVVGAAESLPQRSEEARQVYVAVEPLSQAMQKAFSTPESPLDMAAASGAALREFIGALASDSGVSLSV